MHISLSFFHHLHTHANILTLWLVKTSTLMWSFNIYNFFFSNIDINRLFFLQLLENDAAKRKKIRFSFTDYDYSTSMRESNVKRDVCVGFKARTKITDISGRKSNIRLWHFSTYFLLARLHYDSISHFWRQKFPLSRLLVGVLIRYRLSITKISFTHRDIECVPRNHHMMKICLILMRFKENSSKNHLKGSGCFSNLTWNFFCIPLPCPTKTA